MQVLAAASTCILNLYFYEPPQAVRIHNKEDILGDNKLIQKVSGKSFVIDYTIKSATNKKKMDGT
jgi:hypothetical protein